MTPTGREKVLNEQIIVRMPAKLKAALQALADKIDRDLSYYVRGVLEDHVVAKKRK